MADIRIADIKRRNGILCVDVRNDGHYDFEITSLYGNRIYVTGYPYGLSCHCDDGEHSFFFDKGVTDFVAIRLFMRNNPDYFLWETFLSKGEATVFDGKLAAQDFLRNLLSRFGVRDVFPQEERLSLVPSEFRGSAVAAYHSIADGDKDWQKLVKVLSGSMGVDYGPLMPKVSFLSPVFERCCDLLWAFASDILSGITAYGSDV